ncbi:MAG: HAMP domain-containing histidine kinase [Bacteroidetes bacterium]|nr:HAMP domain-containing histidine kinase [Bacteroidota bacterium]MBS1649151.1 HAMP domain-containing histidine kinase [Bacteroidota bacterium]
MIQEEILLHNLLNSKGLIHQYDKLNTIFNSVREIIFTVDIETGYIEDINDSITKLGYQKEDWEKQSFKNWPLARKKIFFSLVKHGSKSTTEATSTKVLIPIKNTDKKVPYEFSTVYYSFDGKNYLLCVLRDITEQEKLLQELEQALQKERELNELRSSFVSMASHQFRTPLTIIQSGIEIMDMYLEDMPAEKKIRFQKQFSRIQGELERLQTLMNDVLVLGKADVSRTPFHPKQNNIVAFLEQIIQNKYNNRYAKERSVILTTEGKSQPVFYDEKLLDHVFENILSNAYKYSNTGNIDTKVLFEYDNVIISITDYGIGIPENDLVHLFQPFYRASNTDEIQGTGLGLAIVKEFIDLHQGQIFVISELGKGTTVTISLPLNNK